MYDRNHYFGLSQIGYGNTNWKIWDYFQAFKNSYPQERSVKHEKNLKLKVSVSDKKKIGSDIDTEIGLWFRF